MNEFTIAVTLIISLSTVYFIFSPLLGNSIENDEAIELDPNKEFALVLLEELKELTELRDNGNLTEEEFLAQKNLLLKDAETVV